MTETTALANELTETADLAASLTTSTSLATGLAGAIGSSYVRASNQLYFVEFGGKVSRLNLTPAATTIGSATSTIRGTWIFDFETGTETASGGDIWWEQVTETVRKMVPRGGARIAYLGMANYSAITPAYLYGLTYGTAPIPANNDASNQLVDGAVFAVLTGAGNYVKVQVVTYGYNIKIRWVAYRMSPRYQVLGTGYAMPEDIAVGADGRTAYVTERTGNLLRVDLTNAGRAHAAVVSSGMTAPHQVVLDEDRGQAYVVEFGPSGRLLRIELAGGAQTTLLNGLANAIGLLVTADRRYAYVSQQTGGGTVSRFNLSTGEREVIVSGLTSPFFMRWTDEGETGILVAERDPANRVRRIDLSRVPVSTSVIAGVPVRPSSVAITRPDQLLVCCDSEIVQVSLTEAVFSVGGPLFMGIGYVPVTQIVDGYADTTDNPGYFFQVKDAPFGGALPILFNHERAYAEDARYYKFLIDGVEQTQPWSDYRWSTTTNSFVAQVTSPLTGGYYRVRPPAEIWYNHWLGYVLNSTSLSNGPHTFEFRLYRADRTELTTSGVISSRVVRIDNQWPQVSIDAILHDGTTVGTCGIVSGGSSLFTFQITAHDPQEHLLSWSLTALWGNNRSKAVGADNYSNHVSPTRLWGGPGGEIVPAPAWDAVVPGDPFSHWCAHTFHLSVWDRVINGYGYIHHTSYNRSITIILPPAP